MTVRVGRRGALQLAGATIAAGSFAARAAPPRIPQVADRRVIVDNDFAGDPDGLVALAHQLLAPKAVTRLVTVSRLYQKIAPPEFVIRQSAARGARIAEELIERLRPGRRPPVVPGAETVDAAGPSPAARAIVAEAMRDDPLPLVFTCGGPLTNLADALRLEPKIATRMTLIWIGGESYPAGGWEYNLAGDPGAAREVIEHSAMPMWQVTRAGYRMMAYSIAAFEAELRPISPFTEWLYQRFVALPPFIKVGGAWPFGDTPLVLLSSITAESSPSREVIARRINADLTYGEEIPGRRIRLFEAPDARLAFDDLKARLRLQALRIP